MQRRLGEVRAAAVFGVRILRAVCLHGYSFLGFGFAALQRGVLIDINLTSMAYLFKKNRLSN
jgi:hypothetical protein